MQNIELLAQIQERIIECRRAAAEASDHGLALFLYRLADEVEAGAREADLIGEATPPQLARHHGLASPGLRLPR
jgi:hypothetical protein